MPSADLAETTTPRFALTLTRLAWLVPLTAIGLALRLPIRDNSYLWHLRAGERQIEAGSVLTSDPFSFTVAGNPWRTQSWLMDLAYGWLEGLRALISADLTVLVSAVVLLSAVALRLARRQSGLLAPLGVLWVMWITLGYFTARPVFPSLAMLAVLVLVLDDIRLRWTVPLLFWVWASIHGGFIVGIGYLVLDALRLKERRHITTLLASLVAVTLTAHGWALWEILLRFGGSSANLDLIQEWRPPDFMTLPLLPFLLGIVGLLVVGMRGRLATRDLWVIVPFLVFAFTANRAVPLAAIVLVPFIFPPPRAVRIGTTPLARPVAWATIVIIVSLPFLIPVEDPGLAGRFPVEAATHLASLPTFHDDGVGGYLIYTGHPGGVFVDDRAELYGEVYADALAARDAEPGWEEMFAEYDIAQVLLLKTDAVVAVLQARGWDQTFEDEEYVVLVDGSVTG